MMHAPDYLTAAERLLQQNPLDPDGCAVIAELAQVYQLDRLADRYQRLASSKEPDILTSVDGHDDATLGCLLFLDGQLDDACSVLERAHAAKPDCPYILRSLGRCQAALGRDTLAACSFEAALKRSKHADIQDEIAIELATALFRSGDFSAANGIIPPSSFRASESHVQELASAQEKGLVMRIAELDPYLRERAEIEDWQRCDRLLREQTQFENFVAFFHAVMQKVLGEIIAETPGICRIINFGVLCGRTDYLLARTYPDIDFIGVDRSASVKKMNDEAFKATNLRFEAADIFEFLEELDSSRTLLLHSRTCECLYPQHGQEVVCQLRAAIDR